MIINSVIARSSLLSLISAVATLPTNSRANNKTEVDRTTVAVAEAEIVSLSKGITKSVVSLMRAATGPECQVAPRPTTISKNEAVVTSEEVSMRSLEQLRS